MRIHPLLLRWQGARPPAGSRCVFPGLRRIGGDRTPDPTSLPARVGSEKTTGNLREGAAVSIFDLRRISVPICHQDDIPDTIPEPVSEPINREKSSCSPQRARVRLGRARCRQLVPRSTVQYPAAGLWGTSAPLLVQVRNSFSNAAVPHIPDPGRVTSPVSGTTLTTGDDPVKTIEAELVHGTEPRFRTDKTDGSRDLTQVVRAARR